MLRNGGQGNRRNRGRWMGMRRNEGHGNRRDRGRRMVEKEWRG